MTIKEAVRDILEAYPEARDNDNELIYRTLRYMGKPTDYSEMRFHTVNHVETIRRVRQKLQEAYPELRPTPEVEKARLKREDQFHEFCTGRMREL